jgi:hypothetical protein
MSLWIRKKGHTGQWFYLIIEVPFPLVMLVVAVITVILLENLAAAPVGTLLVCFSVAALGSVLVAVAKWSLIRRGVLVSFGSAGMSRGMMIVYRLGWLLLFIGAVVTLFCTRLVLLAPGGPGS